MVQYILLSFLAGVSIYRLCNIIKNLVEMVISYSNVNNVVYKFKSRIRYYPIILITILIINLFAMYGFQNVSKAEMNLTKLIGMGDYMNNAMLSEKIMVVSSLGFIGILVVDFVLSVLLKSIMYEQGIIFHTGKLIKWKDIKSIQCNNSLIKSRKIIIIETKRKGLINLSVDSVECNEVKEIIFNKSGVVSKEIVTEYS